MNKPHSLDIGSDMGQWPVYHDKVILNHLPISAYSGVLKFDMKIFVNEARLEIGKLFTQGVRRGHLCTLDTFLVWRFLPYMGLEAILVIWPGTFEQIFIPTSHGGSIWNFASNGLAFFWGKEVWKCCIWATLVKSQWMTLTFGCHKSSCTHLFDYMYQLSPYRLQYFFENLQLQHFPI